MTSEEVKLICDACTETESPHYVADRDANCERIARALKEAVEATESIMRMDGQEPLVRAACSVILKAICTAMSDGANHDA